MRTLADGAVDTVSFVPIWIVEKRNVGFDGGGGFRRKLVFIERSQDRLRPEHKDIRIARDRARRTEQMGELLPVHPACFRPCRFAQWLSPNCR